MIIHSEQGFHYTNLTYQSKVKQLGLIESMSRKGNRLDNAPIESFFGHMKDEIFNEYMNYYNFDRYQWNLKKMSPMQYRNHLLVA